MSSTELRDAPFEVPAASTEDAQQRIERVLFWCLTTSGLLLAWLLARALLHGRADETSSPRLDLAQCLDLEGYAVHAARMLWLATFAATALHVAPAADRRARAFVRAAASLLAVAVAGRLAPVLFENAETHFEIFWSPYYGIGVELAYVAGFVCFVVAIARLLAAHGVRPPIVLFVLVPLSAIASFVGLGSIEPDYDYQAFEERLANLRVLERACDWGQTILLTSAFGLCVRRWGRARDAALSVRSPIARAWRKAGAGLLLYRATVGLRVGAVVLCTLVCMRISFLGDEVVRAFALVAFLCGSVGLVGLLRYTRLPGASSARAWARAGFALGLSSSLFELVVLLYAYDVIERKAVERGVLFLNAGVLLGVVSVLCLVASFRRVARELGLPEIAKRTAAIGLNVAIPAFIVLLASPFLLERRYNAPIDSALRAFVSGGCLLLLVGLARYSALMKALVYTKPTRDEDELSNDIHAARFAA